MIFAIQAICVVLTLCYTALMLLYRYGWQAQGDFVVAGDFVPGTTITVIVPARNEAGNIKACIDAILTQDYPAHLFEVIVVDDHSTDGTAGIVNSFAHNRVKCISLAEYAGEETIAYKKKALSVGVRQAEGELVVTTDADCIAPRRWLSHLAAAYEAGRPVMIAAPVDYFCDGSVLQVFQSLDFMSMQGITAATHYLKLGSMGNGANLAFSKAVFNALGGYKDIDHLASGDDYLLMNKMMRAYPGRVEYIKSAGAIVRTAPQSTWTGFFNQRIRWASKSGKYDDRLMTAILMLVYLFNLSFFVLLACAFFYPAFLLLALAMLVVKAVVELIYLYPVSKFFKKEKQLVLFPLLQPLHIAYIILAGFLGFVGVYDWKGRKVR